MPTKAGGRRPKNGSNSSGYRSTAQCTTVAAAVGRVRRNFFRQFSPLLRLLAWRGASRLDLASLPPRFLPLLLFIPEKCHFCPAAGMQIPFSWEEEEKAKIAISCVCTQCCCLCRCCFRRSRPHRRHNGKSFLCRE